MNLALEWIRHRILVILRIVLGWFILIPLSHIIPKTKSIIFITRFGRTFEGNLKYLFLHLNSQKLEGYSFYFLTGNREILAELREASLPVLYYPSPRALWRMFRASAIIVDGNEWVRGFKYQVLHAAKKIQLWHGSGMKTVGMLKPRVINQGKLLDLATDLLGLHPKYDILSLNSKTQLETRGNAFNYGKCVINGQPRNDVLFVDSIEPYLVGVDDDAVREVIAKRDQGYKIVLYAPTHRKPTDAFKTLKDTLVPSEVQSFCERHKIFFVFKYHPKTREEHEYAIGGYANLGCYNKDKDIYPLFKYVDLMITDYSSIFVDYILLDRPVLFFNFDYEHYAFSERALQFDYAQVTPGPKCQTLPALFEEIEKILIRGQDAYSQDRRAVLKTFYDIIDGNSSMRIWKEIASILS